MIVDPAAEVSKLAEALDAREDIPAALAVRFSADRSGELGEFLESRGITVEPWSRAGD